MDLKNMNPGGGVEDGIHYLNKQQTFFYWFCFVFVGIIGVYHHI